MSYLEPESQPFYKRGSVWVVLFIILLLAGIFWYVDGVQVIQDMRSAEPVEQE